MASTETATSTPLYSLPNEVLVQILTPFSTRDLLPLASVSRRIHAVILRLLHYRLLLLSSLNEYTLLLECFHPVSRLTDPPVYCTYLGTPGLNDKFEGKGSIYEHCTSSGYLGRLSSIYSCFRPENDAAEVGDDHWAVGSERLDNGEAGGPLVPRPVTKQVSLEHHEDFSQLCSIVSLVKVIPNTKILSTVTELDEGVVRLFRDWLKQESQKIRDSNKFDSSKNSKDESSSDILWVNNKPTVGLKLRVKEKKWDQAMLPVLMHRDEEDAVSYEVEIEELRIRTTHLLLTIEKSMAEQREYRYAVTIGARQVFLRA